MLIGGNLDEDNVSGPWTLQATSSALEVVVQVNNSNFHPPGPENRGGEMTGWLTVFSDDSTAPTQFVKVSLSVDSPKLRIDPEVINVERSEQIAGTKRKVIKLFNDGTEPLTIFTVSPSDHCAEWCMVTPIGEHSAQHTAYHI